MSTTRTSGSAALEVPHALPVRHVLVEERLLGARVVQVVVDDLVAERLARDRPRTRARVIASRSVDGNRFASDSYAFPSSAGGGSSSDLDPVQAGRDDRREGEVRVDVAARDPRLDALRRAVADDAEAARAVVPPPRERRRRPAPGRVALVRVDRRREEDGELLEARRSGRRGSGRRARRRSRTRARRRGRARRARDTSCRSRTRTASP